MTPHGSPERGRRRRTRRRTRRRLLSSSAASSSTPSATLPDDLIYDILSRLPLRSVRWFRCVSKAWSALISDLAFVNLHKSHEPVIVVNYTRCGELRLMDMHDGNIVRVIKDTIATQLICMSVDELLCVMYHLDGVVRVINPTSGKVLVDCPKEFRVCGFGRAVPSGTYKVVGITHSLVCEVLTLGEKTGWRRQPRPPLTSVSHNARPPVIVNGVMYFSTTPDMYNFTLHRFDLESEEWKKTIKGPGTTIFFDRSKRTMEIIVSELNGTLCIVQSEIDVMRRKNNQHVNILLLADPDKDIWNKAYTIPMATSTYVYRPLRVTQDGGRLIFHCTSTDKGGEVRVYNLHTKTCTSLWKLDEISNNIGICNLHLDPFVKGKI